MTWVTHSAGLAVAATVLVAAGSSTALGQSPPTPTQEPSRPSVSLFNHPVADSTKPTVAQESWLTGVELICVGCRGFETTVVRPQSTNPNAPWALEGRWRRQTTLGVFSTGFVGVHNYALPLATAIPPGGALNPAALGTTGLSVDSGVTQWSLTASVEKTLAKRANGASVGVTGDVLIPFQTETVGVRDPRHSALTSPTARVGIVLRW